VALVTITEDDITGFGEWPLSDLTISRIFERLEKDGPRVIGLDIYRDLPQQPGSDVLEKALLENERIIVIRKFASAESEGVNPPAILAGSERVGFTDLIVDPGGVVRRGLLFLDDESGVSFSFSLRLAMAYLADEGVYPQPGEPDPSYIRFGEVTLAPFESDDGPYVDADAAGYQFLLDYREGPAAFKSVSLKDLFEGNYPSAVFRDKIVIIGVSAESVKDTFFTPLDPVSGELATMPGAMVHGYAASQLIRAGLESDAPLTSVDNRLEMLWIALWGVLGCLAGLMVHAFTRLFAVTLMGAAVIAGTSYVLFTYGVWLNMVPAVFSWLVVAALVTAYLSSYERMQRGELMQPSACNAANSCSCSQSMFHLKLPKKSGNAGTSTWNPAACVLTSRRSRSCSPTSNILQRCQRSWSPKP
jgi:adenylate cyclase